MPNTLSYNKLLADTGTLSRRGLFILAAAVTTAILVSEAVRRSKVMPAVFTPGVVGDPAAFAGTVAPASQADLLASAASLVRSAFALYVGETFQVEHASAEAIALQLLKVRDLFAARRLAARGLAIDAEQNFSLQFRGPLDRPLGQAVYRFAHPSLGDFAVLIVPMRPEQDGRYYEAVFNRLREVPAQSGSADRR
jgi:hypothetical protein